MNIDLPASYVAAREACEAAGKRYAAAMDKALDSGVSPINDEEFLSAHAAMNRAREKLSADPHQQWLEDVRRDEMTAHEQMLARQPRTVTGLTLGPDGEPAASSLPLAEAVYERSFEEARIAILFDARAVSTADALRLLRYAIARIEEHGILVSHVPSPWRRGDDLWIDEHPDGSLRSSSRPGAPPPTEPPS